MIDVNQAHLYQSPIQLVGRITLKKNAPYEIFRILSQTKLDKIKNLLFLERKSAVNKREQYVEWNITRIRQLSQIKVNKQNDVPMCDEESSDAISQDSLH